MGKTADYWRSMTFKLFAREQLQLSPQRMKHLMSCNIKFGLDSSIYKQSGRPRVYVT